MIDKAPYKHSQFKHLPLQPVLTDGWNSLTSIRRKQWTISAASFPVWQLVFQEFHLLSATESTSITRLPQQRYLNALYDPPDPLLSLLHIITAFTVSIIINIIAITELVECNNNY